MSGLENSDDGEEGGIAEPDLLLALDSEEDGAMLLTKAKVMKLFGERS